jgi:hypothetical protein
MLGLEEKATVAAQLFRNSEERESRKNQIWFWRFRQLPFFIRACGVVLELTDLIVLELQRK